MKEKPYHKGRLERLAKKRLKAQKMKEQGYSVRQIMRNLGYKSPNSVVILLSNPN